MTITESGTRTGMLLVRGVFEYESSPTLARVQTHLFEIGALILVSSMLAMDSGYVREGSPQSAYQHVAFGQRENARDALRRTTVVRLSYNSPLEVVLGVSAAAGAVSMVGNRMLDLFERIQHARVAKAESDVKVEAALIVADALRQKYQHGEVDYLDLHQVADDAARGALALARLEVLDED